MSEIAVYKGQSPIDYIVGGSTNVPATFNMPGDSLGLANHEHVRAALANATYNRFDAVCKGIIIANPNVRKQYISGSDLVDISTIQVGSLHEFSINSHRQTEGGSQYTVLRTDIGSEYGGFTITKKGNGTVILTRDDDMRALNEDTDEYVQALGQVSRFLEVLAAAHNMPVPTEFTTTTNEEFEKQAKLVQKQENSLKSKAARAARPAAKLAVKAVTKKGKLGERKLSYKRIAALSLLMAVPGYSERVIEDVPIPRPASVELISSTAHAIFDTPPLTPAQQAKKDFRASNANLPGSVYIAQLGTAQDIPVVPDVGADIANNAQEKTFYIGQDNDAITGLAPVRVNLLGKLSPGECAVIGIDQAAQTGNYAVVGTTQQAVQGLQVSASREELNICNTSDKSIFTDNITLYIDARADD